VGLIVVLGAVSGAGERLFVELRDFHSEATRGFDLPEDGFGGNSAGERGTIVFVADDGVDTPKAKAAITAMVGDVSKIKGLTVSSPLDHPQQIAQQGPLAGKLAYATVEFDRTIDDFASIQAMGKKVVALGPEAEASGIRVEFGGQVFASFEPPDSEVLGLGFAIVILILAFGSVLAMGLPIGVAIAGIASGVMVVGLLSNALAMPDFTSTLAVMIGLGVGIDYALFIGSGGPAPGHAGGGGGQARLTPPDGPCCSPEPPSSSRCWAWW
jgi:RND superfamily putative drug exporter